MIVHAMVLEKTGAPLVERELRIASPGPSDVQIRVAACAVCRTDLHVIDGELPDPKLPLVPGHEIVGRIVAVGNDVRGLRPGERVGVPWLGWTCGVCEFCRRGEENLCPNARFTGYQIDGGFAEETVADARYVFPLPDNYSDREAAPLMCAGMIGWRALKAAGHAPRLGFYGFGAAAHLAIQVAREHGQEVYGFVRPGDEKAKAFARAMGATWAGDSDSPPPVALDAAIIFAPAGELVPRALQAVRHGGRVVCGGIHMSDIPSFPYEILWHERSVSSVANLTRRDAEEFLAFAARTKLRTETIAYPLAEANRALADLRRGAFSGAAVLTFRQARGEK
ncbi:MAG: zinc-dependent alcohol dehydrogenase family protein [Rhizomicrobium sp.]